MKKKYMKMTGFLSMVLVLCSFITMRAQTTVSTTGFVNNNGSSVVTFNFVNTNAYPVIITDLASIAGVSGSNTAQLWYKPSAISGPPGAITTANGWTMHSSQPVTTIANTATTTTQPMMSGINLVVPAGSTYGLCFSLVNGNLRYSTIAAGTYTFSGGGVNLVTGTNIGYGGTLASPSNSPRGFLGSVTFIQSVPCSGTPNAGTAAISSSTGCPSVNFNLSATGLSLDSGVTYQWQSSSSPTGPWTNIVGATTPNYTTNVTDTTYFQIVSTCGVSGLSATSNVVSYSAVGDPCACGTYTIVSASSTADEEIGNVTVGTMTNASTCATLAPGAGSIQNRYSNYTGSVTPTSQQVGSTVSFSVDVITCGGNFGNGVQIYIDYNANGSFADPGEQVYSSPAVTTGPHTETGSFTIPVTANIGITRMRVVAVETTFPTTTNYAVTGYTWGETEDYCIDIIPAPPCAGSPTAGTAAISSTTGCPNVNFTLSATGYTVASGIDFQWQSGPTAAGPWTNIVGATTPSYTTSTTDTTFYQLVVTCTPSGLTDTTNIVSYEMVNPGPCICSAYTVVSASSTADEDLGNVTVGSMTNTTTCASVAPGAGSIQNRYSNYAGNVTPATVIAGQSLSFSLSSITCGGNFGNGFQIYIDYNQNGSFADPGEQAYSSGSSPAGPHTETGTFTVPLAATPGVTRMRVVVVESFFPTSTNYAVTGYTWGETEDYCLNIVAPSPIDIAATGFARPLTTGCYSASDSVIVTVSNAGIAVLDFTTDPMTINATVTGPNPLTFAPVIVNTGTLGIGQSMNVTVSTNYNMSAAGTYGFAFSANIAGDGYTPNDSTGPVNFVFNAGTAMAAGNGNVCEGSPANVTVSGYTPTTAAIQWQSSPDNVTWTNIPGQTTPTVTEPAMDTTFYRAVICGVIMSTVDTVFTISVAPAVATNDTICGFGAATLTATGSGQMQWFDAQIGGTRVDTGMTITPSVSATDTFWVANSFVDCGTGGNPVAPTCYPAFTSSCTSADLINNFSTTGGNTNISNLNSGCNGTLPTNTTFFPGQTVTVAPGATFNLTAQSGASWGQGFRLWIDYNADGDFADPGEDVWNSGVSSTAPHTGSVTVPANTAPGPKRMRLMCRFGIVPTTTDYCATTLSFGEVEEYTLNVCLECLSTRVASIVTVDPAPVVTATSSNNICGSGSTTLLATSPNSNYDYAWTPSATLNTPNGDSVIASPSADTYYTVLATDSATGCVDTASVLVRWANAPAIAATVSDDTVCANTAVNLNVAATAPNPVIVGTQNIQNTSTSYPAPYGNFYWGSRHQMLVTAADLIAAGLQPGYITALSFEVPNTNATNPLDNFEIKLATTNVTGITTFQATPMTTVYTSTTYVPTTGVNTHTFQVPFFWDGVSNLLVETCHNNGSFNTNCTFRQSSTAYSSTVYYRADATGVCSNNAVTGSSFQRPNMRFWTTAAWNYAWTPTASLDNPAIANPIATPPTSTTYIVMVTDSLSGCVTNDTVSVMVNPNPMPMFGPDTSICSNTALVLDGTAGTFTYLWQDSTTNQTYTVNSFGIYDVMVTDTTTGCFGADTILVGIDAAPSFTLGADPTVCAGTQVSFSGPSGSYTYLWNTNDTVATITTGTAGSYDLAVTDTMNGCVGRDTVALNVNPVPPVALGADTAVCSADGSLTLSAPAGNFSYAWSTMDSVQMISVNTSGTYYVVVTDNVTSCMSGDTIFVTYNASPTANLGNDTAFCSINGPITLLAPAGPYNYLWNDMSTNITLQTNTTGTYYVDITDTLTGCTTSDTIVVDVPMTPFFQLADTAFCGTQVTLMGPAGPYNYAWSNSAITMSTTVTASGTYSLTVTDSTSGCSYVDSSMVNINAIPTVTASASATTVCQDDANVILTGSPAGGTFSGTSVTGNQFDPSIGAGNYSVSYYFTDVNGCESFDTVNINVSACVGIDEPFVNAGMNVYPNPNSGVFTFTAANQDCQKMTVEIMTVEGQVIQSTQYADVQGNFVQEINLNEFANGTYIMRVITDGAVYTQRIVKQE